MSMARVVITAPVLEGRSKSAVARDYGVSRRWVQKLVARYRVEGEAAFEPRSRRPHSNPRRISQATEDAIVASWVITELSIPNHNRLGNGTLGH
jgi:transposase